MRHQVAGLSAALADRGHEIVAHVLTDDGARWPFQVRRSRWARVCGDSRPRKVIVAPLAFATARLHGFDAIHAHGDSQLLIRRNVPVVRTFYGSAKDEARHAASRRQRLLQEAQYGGERIARRLADRTVAISRATEATVGPVDRIIPCGVDAQRFRPGAKAEVPTVLFIGTMAGRKRGALVLEAFRRVIRARIPSAHLVLIAPDALSEPGVTAIPSASDAEVAEHLRRAWVFTLPSAYEGFGVPYLEAMASGTAVVATPNPGAVELLAGTGAGLLRPAQDVGDALCSLLQTDDVRARMAVAGVAQSQRYAWAAVATAYEELYAEVI